VDLLKLAVDLFNIFLLALDLLLFLGNFGLLFTEVVVPGFFRFDARGLVHHSLL
jgi:hypothetical protein